MRTPDLDYCLEHPEYWEQPIGDTDMACGLMGRKGHGTHWCSTCGRYSDEVLLECEACVVLGTCRWVPEDYNDEEVCDGSE